MRPRPAEGEVDVWVCPLATPESLDESTALLSPDEQERARRMARPELRERYVVAHAALRRVLSGYLGVAPQRIEFDTEAFGKPCLKPGPGVAPLAFNLSHSGDLALVAVANMGPVGVDVEELREVSDTTALARRYFAVAEQARLEGVPESGRSRAFLSQWTAKEAFIKATGEGLRRRLDSFEIAIQPEGRLAIEVLDSAGAAWAGQSFEPCPGYMAAAVQQGDEVTVRICGLGRGDL